MTAKTESKWLPIESAPRDGRDVLISCGEGLRIAQFSYGAWWTGFDCYGNDKWTESATHWQPLPEPPHDR